MGVCFATGDGADAFLGADCMVLVLVEAWEGLGGMPVLGRTHPPQRFRPTWLQTGGSACA